MRCPFANLRLFFAACFCFYAGAASAFDHIMHLKRDAFVYEQYNFRIVDVIDARADREKPFGYMQAISGRYETVGNALLAEDLRAHFKTDTAHFKNSLKIILVVHQVNYNTLGNTDAICLGLDYYKLQNDSATLLYSHFTKYNGTNNQNPDRVFSLAMEQALLDLKKDLWYYKTLPSAPVKASALANTLMASCAKPMPVDSLKEGLYFNINQLYSNTPALTGNYSLAMDTSDINVVQAIISSKQILIDKVYAFVQGQELYVQVAKNTYRRAAFTKDKMIVFPASAQLFEQDLANRPHAASDLLYAASAAASNRCTTSPGFGLGVLVGALVLTAIDRAESPAATKSYQYADLWLDLDTGELTF